MSKKSAKTHPKPPKNAQNDAKPAKNKGGRPPIPNIKQKFAKACELYALAVYTVDEACEQAGISGSLFYELAAENPEFVDTYTRAKRIALYRRLDQAHEILENGRNDYMARIKKEGEAGIVFMPENIRRSESRVNHIRWEAENLLRGQYGQKVQLEHSGGINIIVSVGEKK